ADDGEPLVQAALSEFSEQRPFGGDLSMTLHFDLHGAQMHLPSQGVMKEMPAVGVQRIHGRVRQALLAHVAERGLIDPILNVTGTQQVQEIDPALASRGGKPGKIRIANVRRDAVLTSMSGAR